MVGRDVPTVVSNTIKRGDPCQFRGHLASDSVHLLRILVLPLSQLPRSARQVPVDSSECVEDTLAAFPDGPDDHHKRRDPNPDEEHNDPPGKKLLAEDVP